MLKAVFRITVLAALATFLAVGYWLFCQTSFDPALIDHPAQWSGFSSSDRLLLVSYTTFFLFPPLWLAACVLYLAGRLVCAVLPGARTVRASPVKKSRSRLLYKVLASFLLAYIGLSVVVSLFGFFRESKRATIEDKKVASDTKKDMNAILIVIDALRADHLGCYGYERETSPHLDRFAMEASLFESLYTQASWTKPSMASLFTSLYPTMHATSLRGSGLPDALTTLAEVLQGEGYVTYACVVNPNVKSIFNFNQGFDYYDDSLMRDRRYDIALRNIPLFSELLKKITGKDFRPSDRDTARLVNERVIPWLERHRDESFFMYIHYMDPHFPYTPPEPYRSMFPYERDNRVSYELAQYDGEIRFVDDLLHELFQKLKELGIYDKTLIVVTSDHGEAFWEHGNFQHGRTLYQEEIKVPLLIKGAGVAGRGRVITEQARSIDIMPTVLDLAGVPAGVHLEGESLVPLMEGQKTGGTSEDIFMEEVQRIGQERYFLRGLIRGNRWKYIMTYRSYLRDPEKLGGEELYNLSDDPDERHNLVETEPRILQEMRDTFDYYKQYCEERMLAPSEFELDQETIEHLKTLGYLQ